MRGRKEESKGTGKEEKHGEAREERKGRIKASVHFILPLPLVSVFIVAL